MKLLCRIFPFKQIGWREIGENFIRFRLFQTRWFQVLLHRLDAPKPHKQCHDHPWWFVSLVLSGYWEFHDGVWTWIRPFSLIYRPADWRHNVTTHGVSWSLLITGPKSRAWGFTPTCDA